MDDWLRRGGGLGPGPSGWRTDPLPDPGATKLSSTETVQKPDLYALYLGAACGTPLTLSNHPTATELLAVRLGMTAGADIKDRATVLAEIARKDARG